MCKIRIMAAALITVVFFYSSAYARQINRSGADLAGSVTGQVSVTNVDSADSSKRLNGAHIKIVNKDTGEEATDIIMENGSLVHPLPLGNYSLAQVLAPPDYKLNSKSYEFALQVPQSGDVSNIKVVNATILMTNDLIATDTAATNATADTLTAGDTADLSGNANPGGVPPSDSQAAAAQTPAQDITLSPDPAGSPDQGAAGGSPQGGAQGLLAMADRNPVTGDNSNRLLAILVFCFIIMAGGVISRQHLINRL